MPTRQSTSKPRKTFQPVYLFIPLAFLLGLAAGYLLWAGDRSLASEAASADEIQRVEVSTDDDPSIGPEDAPVTIIEFSDYQCPYCKTWHDEVFDTLMANYPGQIRFVYRDLPLSMHSEAIPAAEAADCAGELGAYWEFHGALYNAHYGLSRTAYEQYAADLGLDAADFAACLDSRRYRNEVESDAADAASVGIDSTPAFVINGRVLFGALPYATFRTVVEEELAAQP